MNQQRTLPPKGDTRDYHVDNIKGVLIFLVVAGHFLSYLQDQNVTFAIGVRTFIYFFHMPGFIFMSGYLAKGFLKKQNKTEKLLSYGWLYLLFKNAIELVHFIFRRPYFADGSHTGALIAIVLLFTAGVWLLAQLYDRFSLFRRGFILLVVGYSLLKTDMLTIGSAPWYLLALILWHIVLYLTKEKKAAYVLAAAVLVAAFANYQESIGRFLTLSRAINFLPFFLLGFYMTPKRLQEALGGKGRRFVLSGIFLAAMVLIIIHGRAVKKWIGVFFFGVSPYSKLLKLGEWYYYAAPLTCILWMAATVVLLFGLFALCPKGKTFLAKLGRNTIGIYILHRLYKDFLIYGGFYGLLCENPYLATGAGLLVSLLVTVVFGTDFWAKALTKLSKVSMGERFYREKTGSGLMETEHRNG
ncbi:MAG: acyltransferase family protein [Bacillota bacterium]|nr:acyltransferase family protein [Bacillota bacterium]